LPFENSGYLEGARPFRVAPNPPEERALELRRTLLETLKQLNRAELEEEGGEGLEAAELLFLLRKGPSPGLSEEELERVIETLVLNGLAGPRDDPQYAWDRGRILGRRYLITTTGKQFLIGQLEKTGRVD
jgi:hypothetical protein